jgi:aryl-phospho-beta-D-glucosidase BglC (GH1 family)
MGCTGSGYNSEFDCVVKLGQTQANKVFQQHWATWITQADIQKMASYGLNTIRIPVGYWIHESQVTSSEHFPQGGFNYLLQVCDWAAQQGFYIIIDLHGAPYSQSAGKNPDTGQYTDPGFYTASDGFSRAEAWLSWMAEAVHTHSQFRNVGMLEILNEPIQDSSKTQGMLNNYYPGAYNAIRAAESNLGITPNNLLHIQVMNQKWGRYVMYSQEFTTTKLTQCTVAIQIKPSRT